jgi:hypothetical protein
MLTGQEQYYLERAGYFIRRAALTREEVEPLLVAAERVMEKCRSGAQTKDSHSAGTQCGGTVVTHLFHPDVREVALLEVLGDDAILGALRDALGPTVRYDSASLLVDPAEHGADGQWRRDLALRLDAPPNEQRAVLAKGQHALHVNLALLPDETLWLLPGTHTEPPSQEQAVAIVTEPTSDVPGQVCVRLQPGDAVFYSPNLLHRAKTDRAGPRRTLLYGVSASQANRPAAAEPWLTDSAFLRALPAALRPLFDRYVAVLQGGN